MRLSGSIPSVDWRIHPVLPFGVPLHFIETVLINPLDVPQLGAGECTATTALGQPLVTRFSIKLVYAAGQGFCWWAPCFRHHRAD
jgi:hypothetical protein